MRPLDNRCCARCGRSERDDEQQARFELEIALSEDDPERRFDAYMEDAAELNWLYDVEGGWACWDCLTLEEQRRENFECERCGAQYHDDGRDSDAGWIVEMAARVSERRVLCPDCITDEENEEDTVRLIAGVEEGKRRCAAAGERYPADLARLAVLERARLKLRRQKSDELERLVATNGEEEER
jgi:hypothetical protein